MIVLSCIVLVHNTMTAYITTLKPQLAHVNVIMCVRFFAASNPAYIYSVGSSLVLVDVDIDDKHPDNIEAWPRVVISERGRVQALATHVERALVYFSDTISGAVYRTRRSEWEATELTVQQPHVEGLLPTSDSRSFSRNIALSVNFNSV